MALFQHCQTLAYLFWKSFEGVLGIQDVLEHGLPDGPGSKVVTVVENGHFLQAVDHVERLIFIGRLFL